MYSVTDQPAIPSGDNRATGAARDASGYALFSGGETGAAHVLAHRAFDTGRLREGHRRLGDWLTGRTGSGSDWVHLQFHMAVFELELGHWESARQRFDEQILPTAATTEEALTDAPALLWRLDLNAPRPTALPWQALRDTALQSLQRPNKPFVELHNLLALAGAGDIRSLDRWLQRPEPMTTDAGHQTLMTMAVALRAYACGEFTQAASLLEAVLPHIGDVGGSLAQNQLFTDLAAAAWRRDYAAAA